MTDEYLYIVIYELYAFIFLGIRTYEFWISRKRTITTSTKSVLDRSLVLCVLFLFYFSMFYYPFFPDGSLFKKFNNDLVRWFGLFLTLLCLILLLLAAKTLGSNWSAFVEPYDDHTLVTTGIYRFIRHPIYTALLGFVIGMSLITTDPLILLVLVIPHILLFSLRIPKEENLLLETFGDEYRNYLMTTKRLIPFIY